MLGGAPHDAGRLLWGIIVLQLAAALLTWQLHEEPPLFISNAGLAIAGLLLPTLMGFLYAAWKDPLRRRQIAVLFDVGTFLPRSYHPLSPPCYAERAVPDLQRRLWWLHDNDDRGSVVLVGHSQGTMLAIAALLQQERRPPGGGHVSLITFGSPADKLYAWAFPAYFTTERLMPLAPGGGGHVHDWLNFYYPTDPIGGPVAERMASPARELVDKSLPDPAESWYVYGQPLPAPQGHSGYWSDSRVWSAVNHVAAVSQPAGR
jgi:pimeloyl-ACP methyl ester carboxylesterase